MKKFLYVAMLAVLPLTAMAQHEEDTENGVVSLAGREGFTIGTKKGDFVFKPYLLVQTSANFNWYDDEGLDKAYNQDNISIFFTFINNAFHSRFKLSSKLSTCNYSSHV